MRGRLRTPIGLGLGLGLVMSLILGSGCRSLTVQEEKELGREAQRQVRQQAQFMRDPVVVRYTRNLGGKLVDAALPSPFEFRFYVLEDEALNAFAVPGGAIYVNTGLILATKDASELAGVLAHEIGHVTARHVAQLYRRGRNTSVATNVLTLLIAILAGGPVAQAGQVMTGMAAQAYMATFTQEAEREADQLAIDTLIRAGYDPDGMVTMFQTLQEEAEGGLPMPQFLSSHPAPSDRIQSARAAIARRRRPPGLLRDDGGRLQIVQQRIKLIIGTDVEDYRDQEDE